MLGVLILYISGGTPNDKFFEKLLIAILFTLRVFARILLRGNHRRNTFRISFWCLAWDANPGFSSNKPTHYLLDHRDFYNIKWCEKLSRNPDGNNVMINYICMYVCISLWLLFHISWSWRSFIGQILRNSYDLSC